MAYTNKKRDCIFSRLCISISLMVEDHVLPLKGRNCNWPGSGVISSLLEKTQSPCLKLLSCKYTKHLNCRQKMQLKMLFTAIFHFKKRLILTWYKTYGREQLNVIWTTLCYIETSENQKQRMTKHTPLVCITKYFS